MENKIWLTIIGSFFLGLISGSCQSQETTSRFVREQGGQYHWTDSYIGKLADSLNYWDSDKKLPSYLFDKNLDIRQMGTLSRFKTDPSSKWLLSIRKSIFTRVYNEEALEYIVGYEDERLDLLYDPKEYPQRAHIGSPYSGPGPNFFWMELSTRELAKIRLDEIRIAKQKFESTD